VGKPDGKRALGRPRSRWDDNKKFMFKKWYGGMFWIRLAQEKDRRRSLMNAVKLRNVLIMLLRVNEQRNILHEIRKRKANWIGHI